MNIGESIKKLRKKEGMTQGQLSEKAGLTRAALSRIESGKVVPKKETADRIGEVLGVPKEMLLLLSLNREDVPDRKKPIYDMLMPALTEIGMSIFGKETTPIPSPVKTK